jgi:hypothetical protein
MPGARRTKEGLDMSFSMAIFAYLGPETMLPMTSAVAGVAGVVMLFGRGSFRWASEKVRGLASRIRRRPKPTGKSRKIGRGPVRSTDQSAKDKAEV